MVKQMSIERAAVVLPSCTRHSVGAMYASPGRTSREKTVLEFPSVAAKHWSTKYPGPSGIAQRSFSKSTGVVIKNRCRVDAPRLTNVLLLLYRRPEMDAGPVANFFR